MSNKSEANSRLSRYLRSRGTWAPKNLEHYKAPHGDRHMLCCLCDAHHDSHIFHRREIKNLTIGVLISGVYTCDVCFDNIRDMEIFLPTASNVGPSMDVSKNAKIDYLLYEAKFSEDAYHYLDHLQSRWEFPQADAEYAVQDVCYFCEGKVQKEIITQELWVPIGAIDFYTIDGGNLLVCKSCFSDIESRLPENSIRFFYMNQFTTDYCETCKTSYFITKEEDEMRNNSSLRGKFQCGPCSYKYLHTTELDRLFIPKKNTSGRLSRYVDDVCDLCKEAFTIDQMLLPTFVAETHINDNAKILCDNCKCQGVLAFEAIRRTFTVYNLAQQNGAYYITVRTIEGTILENHKTSDVHIFENLLDNLLDIEDVSRPKPLKM